MHAIMDTNYACNKTPILKVDPFSSTRKERREVISNKLTTNTHSDYTHTTNRHSDYAIIDSNTIPLKNKRIESKNMCAGGDLQGCALAPSGSRIARPKKLFEDARTRCTC